MSVIRELLDRVQGKAPPGAKRSPNWTKVRRAYMDEHPACEVCGRTGITHGLEAHHIIPFHIAPDLELDPENLASLCRRCHLLVGHLGAWSRVNLAAESDIRAWNFKITQAKG